MNPTYLKEIIQNYSVLQKQISMIEDVLYPAIQRALKIRLELIRKSNGEHKRDIINYPDNFFTDGIENIEHVTSDVIRVECYCDGDSNVWVTFPTKVISDFFFDRPAFEKFFVDEHEEIVKKHFEAKFSAIDAAKKAEYDQYIELKKKFESSN